MTKAEKRVAVAKDVLKQVRAQKIIATSGIYINAYTTPGVKVGADLQELMREGKVRKCDACAIGSVFMSYARLYDDVQVGGWDGLNYIPSNVLVAGRGRLHGGPGHSVLRAIFSDAQMTAIERAFEGGWEFEYPKDEPRLVAIMRNIVRNKGTFKPGAR